MVTANTKYSDRHITNKRFASLLARVKGALKTKGIIAKNNEDIISSCIIIIAPLS